MAVAPGAEAAGAPPQPDLYEAIAVVRPCGRSFVAFRARDESVTLCPPVPARYRARGLSAHEFWGLELVKNPNPAGPTAFEVWWTGARHEAREVLGGVFLRDKLLDPFHDILATQGMFDLVFLVWQGLQPGLATAPAAPVHLLGGARFHPDSPAREDELAELLSAFERELAEVGPEPPTG